MTKAVIFKVVLILCLALAAPGVCGDEGAPSTIWDKFLRDYEKEMIDNKWSLRYTLASFWHYIDTGPKGVEKWKEYARERGLGAKP